MGPRSLILGLLLALFVALATYFNDWVVVQTHLVGNHLPIGVFGVLILLLLVANPLFKLVGRRWMLSAPELAIIVAIGLMAAVWAGSNFYRTFVTNMVFPANDLRSESGWRSAQIMSYLPGGSAQVAEGHVRSWTELLAVLNRAASEPQTPLEHAIAEELGHEERLLIQQAVDADQPGEMARRVLTLVNEILIDPTARDADQPLYAVLPGRSVAVDAALAERDKAEAALDALQDRLGQAKLAVDQVRAEFGERMSELIRQEERLSGRIRAVNLQLGDDPGKEALKRELAELETRRALVREDLSTYRDALAPLVREVQRLRWQIGYYRSVAERAERHANRAALVVMTDGLILPAPQGDGVYLNDGDIDPFASEVLVQGWNGDRPLGLMDLGWWAWWPTIRTWGSIALLLTLAIFCLSIIVHPQWSKRELLNYPIVRFVEAVTAPGPSGLPKVIASRLFWVGFLGVLAIHTWNGLNAWFPGYLLHIPLQIDLWPARALFENTSKTPTSWLLWAPIMYFSVIGFAYFLNTEVSLSVGLALPLWAFFGGLLVANGVAIENAMYGSSMITMFRFGAYLGLALILLYIGRRYYGNVLVSAFGIPRARETAAYATWAMRGLLVCLLLAGWALHVFVGLDWLLAAAFILVLLIMSLGMARISAETGAFFVQPNFMAVGVIAAFLGGSGLGPEAFFALAVASAVMMTDPRESAMPFFVNALHMGQRVGKASPARTAFPLAATLIVAFIVAGGSTLYWQYAEGSGTTDSWARSVSNEVPNRVEQTITDLNARGELTTSNMLEGLDRLGAATPDWSAMGWLLGGVSIVMFFSLLRLRLAWWPLHPVMFLLWATYALNHLWFSFLLGWLAKMSVTKFAGTRGYHAVIPLMVGLVAGELLAAFGWTLVGASYYFIQGSSPVSFRILPG